MPRQAWGRVASTWPGRRRHRCFIERADPREHGPGGQHGEEPRGNRHRGKSPTRVAVHCQGSDVVKRWPAHIFHPRSRTPPVLKWRNDAVSRARTSAGAPERYAPATLFRLAGAFGTPGGLLGQGAERAQAGGPRRSGMGRRTGTGERRAGMRTHRSDAYFCIRTGRLTLIACPPSHPASAPTGPEPESTPVPSAEPEAFQVEPAPGPARDRLAPPPAPPAPPAPPSAPQPVPAAPIPQPTSPVSAPRRRRLGRGGRAVIGTVLVLVLVITGAVTWMVIRSRSSETHKTPPSLQAILDLSNLGGNPDAT